MGLSTKELEGRLYNNYYLGVLRRKCYVMKKKESL
jgi:hypothetical protein